MIDKELLFNIAAVQATSSDDTDINKYVIELLSTIKGVKVSRDPFGNIYAIKGSGPKGYKCIVSHTDTVHSMEQNRKLFVHDGVLFAMANNDAESKYNRAYSQIKQVGIGGDDKAGIYTCIKAMQDFDNIKSVFFRFEETGCRGSNASNIKFFDDCNFVVQCDRKGATDFITYTNGIMIASEEFKSSMESINKKYGFSSAQGTSTDVGALKRRGLPVSACNISSGYYDPHSDKETINMKDLDNTYNMVSEMFSVYGETRFNHEYAEVKATHLPYYRSKVLQRKFTNTINDNYFINNVIQPQLFDLDIKQGPIMFSRIGLSNFFRYLGDEIIDIEGGCPECGKENKLVYLTDAREFLCSGESHMEGIVHMPLYKQCRLRENEVWYVYNNLYDIWIPENEAIWDNVLQTYSSLQYK